MSNGWRTQIEQHGAELLITNEIGQVSRGRMVSQTQFVATDWFYGGWALVGTLSDSNQRIDWNNGATWLVPQSLPARPDVSGAWLLNGQWTQIRQLGDELTLVNSLGQVSTGSISDQGNITADLWRDQAGNPVIGHLKGSVINWSDGTQWTRATFAPPALSHVWTTNSYQTTQIDPNGGQLLLTDALAGETGAGSPGGIGSSPGLRGFRINSTRRGTSHDFRSRKRLCRCLAVHAARTFAESNPEVAG